ncbi:MAG: RNA methyltransferase [Flavobacteriales bacterium]|nr:RNA methyltransferase [Flavobacteriales bacterium]MEB2341112.1 RNA methyltransferase [Flavobacteriia bacterium]
MSGPAHVKRVRALHQRKFREAEGLFLAQGRKLVSEALACGWQVKELFATGEAARTLRLRQATVVPAKDLGRMGTFEQGNEVLAVVRKPAPPALAIPGGQAFVLALDHVSDPGNLGTLLRIADWFGARQVWCTPGSVEVWNPKCVQASMGSLFRVPVVYTDLPSALAKAADAGVQAYKAEASGTDVFQVALQRPCVLVMGSESHGLSDAVKAGPGTSIAIPPFGGAESLNVAAAAAALCMELARQGRNDALPAP